MKTLFAIAALCLSSVAFAAPKGAAPAVKPLGSSSGARSAILKAYPGLKSAEIGSVKREGMALAGGVKASDVFSTSVKQQVFLPGMKSLAAGTVVNAIAEKVGNKTEYKITTGAIDF